MNRSRLIALIATVLFHAAVLALMLILFLRFSPQEIEERTWPPVDEDEILYGGEYVMAGDDPTPDPTTQPSQPTQPSQTSQPTQPSQTSQTSTTSPTGQTQPNPEEEAQQLEQQRREEAARRISSRVNFGNGSNTESGAKSPGSPGGNTNQGALAGMPGFDLHGRTLASWSKPSGTATGKIVVQVHVDRRGRVTKAEYVSGSGAIAGNMAARRSCEQAAMKSAFSVAENAPVDQVGHITYRFE